MQTEQIPDTRPIASNARANAMARNADVTTPIEPTRPQVTFTIHALLDDFPLDVQFVGTAEQLASTVKRLRDLGAVPPTRAARAEVAAEKARTAPVCEFHGAMKESSKQAGSYYCPAKMGDGSYCKSKG